MLAVFPAILDDYWRDWFTIAGLVVGCLGLVATVVGLAYALRQIGLTKSAAEAAREAANAATTQNQRYFHRYAVHNADRFFKDVRHHVRIMNWEMAVQRLTDLAEQTAQIAQLDASLNDEWKRLTRAARKWSQTIKGIGDNDKLRTKWNTFSLRIENAIDNYRGPFPEPGEEVPDDTI